MDIKEPKSLSYFKEGTHVDNSYEEIEAPIVTVLFNAITGGKGKVYKKKDKEK